MLKALENAVALTAAVAALLVLFAQPSESSSMPVPIVLVAGPEHVATTIPESAVTVEDALTHLHVSTKDTLILPPANTTVTPNMVIRVLPTRTIIIKDGADAPVVFETTRTTVGAALEEAGIRLRERDTVLPDALHPASEDLEVFITRIDVVEEIQEVIIPHTTIAVDDPERLWASEKLINEGADGLAEEAVRLTYRNGSLLERTVLERTVLAEPVPREVRRGTKIITENPQEGGASWYRYKHCDCAAHNQYPRGTWILVTSLLDGSQEIIKTNDWGPDPAVHPDRVIDLDATVFTRFAPLWKGVIPVRIERILTE